VSSEEAELGELVDEALVPTAEELATPPGTGVIEFAASE
jgi:hypothetical protein